MLTGSAVLLDIEMMTEHDKLELIVIEALAQSVEELLSEKEISTRVERMLGRLRKTTLKFKHIPSKGRKQADL